MQQKKRRVIMIIKREYVPFCVLFKSDKKAQRIFEKAFEESYLKEDRERIMEMLLPQCLYQKDMGWSFKKLCDVVDGFEKLDVEDPYDNGFAYKDINDTQIVRKDENSVVLHLLSKVDGYSNIVKVVTIEG